MKEFEGMPGPWKLTAMQPDKHLLHETYVVFPAAHLQGGPAVCTISPVYNFTELDQANAHLICAAPDLLEALQIILWDYKSLIKNADFQPSAIIAREAIKKALNLTTAEMNDPDTNRIVPIELHGDNTAPVENLLYDAEWFDIGEMDKNVKFVQSKYIVKRNPDYYKGKADQEAASE